jgi:predicted metalloprotease
MLAVSTKRRHSPVRLVSSLLALVMVLAGCSIRVRGDGTVKLAPDANLQVNGGTDGPFDTTAKNALSDIIDFWKENYPKIANGRSLPALRGGLFSIDGAEVVKTGDISGAAADEGCLRHDPSAIVDNAFYCQVDDSIVWDRAPDHLLSAIASQVPDDAGALFIAMAFAHEFGHAVQQRVGVLAQNLPTIYTESQADCAAGAWVSTVLSHQTPHFSATAQQVDDALSGYLLVRDKTPLSSDKISHGNGFDRLSAIADGITHGVTFCYSDNYFDRQFTERPYTTDSDYLAGGNECFAQVIDAGPPPTTAGCTGGGGLQPSLNTFWTRAAASVNKKWSNVRIAQADHPKCAADSGSEFGYCPDDNTVYFSPTFAKQAYYSLQALSVSRSTGEVKVLDNQPADFALGTLFAMTWGFAVRHQLFNLAIDDGAALLAAACYVGAYSKSINTGTQGFQLSPPDLDEATSAMMTLVPMEQAFGARDTTGLQRVQAFVKGYHGGLSVC